MGDREIQSYNKYLLSAIDSFIYQQEYDKYIKMNLYLILLSFNHNYQEKIYQNEIDIIENYLRKVNNLKVKIQLKRKQEEIDNLLKEIDEIYQNNQEIIAKYNTENLDITNLLKTKEPTNITLIVDKLTKEKFKSINEKETNDNQRDNIFENIFKYPFHIDHDIIYINNNEITIPLNKFYEIFKYLLNIKNYTPIFSNEEINTCHKNLTMSIIDTINTNKFQNNEVIISLILVYLMNKNIPNYETIPTNKFNIDNIKINELYSLAKQTEPNENQLKWKNIFIPNSYLYQKIKTIIEQGTYYFKDNNLIMESINDFKIHISIDDINKFLKENLKNIINQQT